MGRIRLGLAQINAVVGDVEGNADAMLSMMSAARDRGVDLLAFPELAIPGYPPEDLLLKPAFVEAGRRAVERLAKETKDLVVVLGFAERDVDLFNAAAVLADGRWVATYRKQRLPNYGVFDELRYFRPGTGELLIDVAGARVGVTVCEDLWLPGRPLSALSEAGAQLVVNINASPFHRGKWRDRHRMLATRATDYGVAIAYVNRVGGQDELVFDGDSMVLSAEGVVLAEAAPFEEELLVCDVDLDHILRARLHDPRGRHGEREDMSAVSRVHISDRSRAADLPAAVPGNATEHDDTAEVYAALVLGTRDYVVKNGFDQVLLGLSGGIDSALVATVAVDALGPGAVTGVALPSRYSSEGSRTDAEALGNALGIELLTIPIEPAFESLLAVLEPVFAGTEADVTEENLQARIRGVLLMALSNKFGWLLLTTGNKSELAAGYATLYGDMAGGFALLKDVPKTLVFDLARWRNTRATTPVIPESIISKPPSAELRADQRDTDSLPEYDVLDPILERYVEDDWTLGELVAAGHDEAIVRRVIGLVDRAEYKRRQAAPGVKITPRAFGKDRRLPITSAWRER